MYDVGVWLQGAGRLPHAFVAYGLPWQHCEQREDDTWTLFVAAPLRGNARMFDDVLRVLSHESQVVWDVQFVVEDERGCLPRHPPDYDDVETVAFKVTGDFVQRLANPADDFLPGSKAPCLRLLQPGKDVVVSEEPQGLIATAGDEMLFKSPMVTFLETHSHGLERGNAVVLRGSDLKAWHRLRPREGVDVVSAEFFSPVECSRCHSLLVSDSGVLFGSRQPDLQIDFDRTRLGHYAKVPALIASPGVAAEMARRFGPSARYGAFPILDIDGPTAAQVRRVRSLLAPFRGRHPKWTIDPQAEWDRMKSVRS